MKFGKFVFDFKYKKGLAKEGKDFHTCGLYQFCDSCYKYTDERKNLSF